MKKIEAMGVQECRKAIEQARARQAELREWFADHRPPSPPPPATSGPAPARDPLAGAGPKYREAVEGGTPEELAEIEERRTVHEAEAFQVGIRLDALKARLGAAQEEEARDAAPGELGRLRDELPALLDRSEAALTEAEAALEDTASWLRKVGELRALTADDSPFVDAADLYRLGKVRRHRIVDEDTRVVGSATGGERTAPALFRGRSEALSAVALLGRPDEGWLARIVKFLSGGREPEPHRREQAEKDARRKLDEQRLAALSSGDLESVGDPKALAERAAEDGARSAKQREARRELLTR
jgi:hypothetical protein